ncbi:DciA family protein [Streptomyces sp. NPDC127038]|uniref:DciA family protein n=1 Tax=Streptomyces sp. NPDC127038 TaxID=3347114 RepID=UPI0036662FBE
MNGSEVSGVDLARVALRAAMEAARANGGGPKAKAKPRIVRTVRRDGREPMGLGAAIGALVTERAWELPAAGATLRERWAAITPELAGHVAAVSYDADSGQLTVCPESAAWATKARLEQTRIIAAANQSAGRTVVRTLRILAPGTVSVPEPADSDPEPAAAGQPRTRETASDGYRRALAAHQEAAPPSRMDPHITAAVERQTAAMRELSRRAFPEPDAVQDAASAPIEQALTERRRQAAATEAAALRRARVERPRPDPELGQRALSIVCEQQRCPPEVWSSRFPPAVPRD